MDQSDQNRREPCHGPDWQLPEPPPQRGEKRGSGQRAEISQSTERPAKQQEWRRIEERLVSGRAREIFPLDRDMRRCVVRVAAVPEQPRFGPEAQEIGTEQEAVA